MTVETDNTNTRRDETEYSNGTQRKQESQTIVLLFPAIFFVHFHYPCLYLRSLTCARVINCSSDRFVSFRMGAGGPPCRYVLKSVEGFIFMS
jgi:hypothetical protein